MAASHIQMIPQKHIDKDRNFSSGPGKMKKGSGSARQSRQTGHTETGKCGRLPVPEVGFTSWPGWDGKAPLESFLSPQSPPERRCGILHLSLVCMMWTLGLMVDLHIQPQVVPYQPQQCSNRDWENYWDDVWSKTEGTELMWSQNLFLFDRIWNVSLFACLFLYPS